eukprot:Tbor_TRINITY_DN6045_c2_g2::TRINITY_DN6045_c2_g2_i1::g.11436::m.11436
MTTNNNNNNIIKYSIIVPAYKESGNIEQLVRRVFKALENNGYKRGTVEMIIIDDNSNDGSVDIVNKLRMEDPSENNNNNLNNNNIIILPAGSWEAAEGTDYYWSEV